jgi:hypothetical protein
LSLRASASAVAMPPPIVLSSSLPPSDERDQARCERADHPLVLCEQVDRPSVIGQANTIARGGRREAAQKSEVVERNRPWIVLVPPYETAVS